jgi:hypothetical protein
VRPLMRVAGTGAMVIVVASGLAACGGHDTAEGRRPSDDSTSLPAVRAHEPESATHFIRRWSAAEARMMNTGKTSRYLAPSKGCQDCHSLAGSVVHDYAAGGFVRWRGWSIESVEASPSSTDVVTYTVGAHSAPMTVKESSSGREQHVPGRPVTYLVGLVSKAGTYTVASRTLTGS